MFDQKMLDGKKEKQKTHTQTMLSSFLVPNKKKPINNPIPINNATEKNVGGNIGNDNSSRIERCNGESNSATANTEVKRSLVMNYVFIDMTCIQSLVYFCCLLAC